MLACDSCITSSVERNSTTHSDARTLISDLLVSYSVFTFQPTDVTGVLSYHYVYVSNGAPPM